MALLGCGARASVDPRWSHILCAGSASMSTSDVPAPSGVHHRVTEQLPVCFGFFLLFLPFFFLSSSLYEGWRLVRGVGGIKCCFPEGHDRDK